MLFNPSVRAVLFSSTLLAGLYFTTPLLAQTSSLVEQIDLGRSTSMTGISQMQAQILAPIQSYLAQIKEFSNGQNYLGMLDRYLGQLSTLLQGSLQQVLGAMGLPDPQKVLEQLVGKITQTEPAAKADGGINPVAWNRGGDLLPILQTGRSQVQRILDQKNQQSYVNELERLTDLVSRADQTVSATSQAISAAGQTASSVSQITSRSQQQAQQAQQRVSTQDALKDLNLTAADLSTQLGTQTGMLSTINQVQGTQLNLQTAQLQTEVATVAHSQQINLNTAVAAQQLTSLHELSQGQERLRLLQNQATAAQLMQTSQTGFRFMR